MTQHLIHQIEAEQVAAMHRILPEFRPGDTVRLGIRVIEGNRERVQMFEGVCIARRDAGWRSSLTVRKMSFNVGVERTFMLYHHRLEHMEVLRRGRLRRAKLYYLRGRTGRRARIVQTRSRASQRSLMVNAPAE